MPRRRLSLAALLLAVLGCSDDGLSLFGPSELLGATYALTSVNGEPLPFTLWTEASGASATLVSESLVFGIGDRVERRRVLRQTSAQGATTTEAMAIPQEYRRSGLAIVIGWFEPCPPNALCVANDTGTLTSSALRLTSNMYHVGGRAAELHYEAMPAP